MVIGIHNQEKKYDFYNELINLELAYCFCNMLILSGKDKFMEKKKIFNIIICIAAFAMIISFFVSRFGIIGRIKEAKEEKQEEAQNRVWEGKNVGDMDLKLKINDVGKVFEELDAGFLKITVKSDKCKYTGGTEQQQKIEDLKGLTYERVQIFNAFQPGEDGEYSKNTYCWGFVPKDCKYVMAGKNKFDVQKVKINTKTDGVLECRVCLFYVEPADVDKAFESGFLDMYDEKGKKHNSAM